MILQADTAKQATAKVQNTKRPIILLESLPIDCLAHGLTLILASFHLLRTIEGMPWMLKVREASRITMMKQKTFSGLQT